MEERRAYFDHAATTPPDPRVVEAMLPYLTTRWGNPSSIYYEAREARKGLDQARRTVAAILGAKPNDVIFTSGGTESDNLALRGVAYASRQRGRHLVTTAIEHHAVLHTVERLEQEGFRVTLLPVDREGFVDLDALAEAVTEETTLVSVMYANNEVGTIEPIAEAARIAKRRNPHVAFHTDAVQAAGALPIEVDALGVDLLSIAAHKLYGPKGVGALYVRPRTPFLPQTLGGSQERNRRAGTENVAGAVGLARALELAYEELDSRNAHCRELRDRLLEEVPARVRGAHITGPLDRSRRLPNNASFCIEGVEGEAVLIQLDLEGFAASSGSACTTASLEPSHVLTAMGLPEDLARGSLRLTVGKDNTHEEVDRLLEALPRIVERIRALAPSPRPKYAGTGLG
ncbi:MAG TPA: cysteine desulfurase family protein [Dehalococcoidia bacterium]|nr:cysteine desulfurase family protein [Dehalococcoidia bacterium]